MDPQNTSSSMANGLSCPIPIQEYPHVLLAHGGGGRLMHQLIDKMFRPVFQNPWLQVGHDGAVFNLNHHRMAFTTDTYVIQPIFFPGGDIGSLAVFGTVNDLAMCGAKPLYLSVGFVLEEGLPMDTLWRIVQSIQRAAKLAGVHIVTGDTKVVDRGKGDQIFINTAGIGMVEHDLVVAPHSIRPGDVILVNGDLGRHGIAIMVQREGLEFETTIESDSMPLAQLVLELIRAGVEVHCLRDLTRGGLASATNEIAETAHMKLELDEKAIPVRDEVCAACEILGLDPLYVANEGRFIAFLPESQADLALRICHANPAGQEAAIIGRVLDQKEAVVLLRSQIGTHRIVDMISGEQLPRIC